MSEPRKERVESKGERARKTLIPGTGLFVLAGLTFAAGTVLISLGGGGRVDVAPGGALEVPVQVGVAGSGENLASLDLRITWDPSNLTFVSAAGGGFGTVTLNEVDVASGGLRGNLFNATGTTGDFDALSFIMNAANLADPTLTTTQPEFTLTETGTHLIQVFAVNYARTGTYGIGVESDSP